MTARAQRSARCVICASERIQRNHVGGQNHVAWFTMPFCPAHHDQFHALVTAAGIDLEYTADPRERLLRSLQATIVCQWMLTEALKNLNSQGKQ
jgi:hypothetical protein